MKIAIMAPLVTAIREPQQGGSQAFVSDLARGLVGRGHDVPARDPGSTPVSITSTPAICDPEAA